MTLLFFYSKVVSVDHNKPIIVPAGQDSFSQIGEKCCLFFLPSGRFSIVVSVIILFCLLNCTMLHEKKRTLKRFCVPAGTSL